MKKGKDRNMEPVVSLFVGLCPAAPKAHYCRLQAYTEMEECQKLHKMKESRSLPREKSLLQKRCTRPDGCCSDGLKIGKHQEVDAPSTGPKRYLSEQDKRKPNHCKK